MRFVASQAVKTAKTACFRVVQIGLAKSELVFLPFSATIPLVVRVNATRWTEVPRERPSLVWMPRGGPNLERRCSLECFCSSQRGGLA